MPVTSSFVLVLLLILLSKSTVFGVALMSVCCAFSLRKAYGKEGGSGENEHCFDRRAFERGVLCIFFGAVLFSLLAGRGEERRLSAVFHTSLLLADTFLVTLLVFSFGVILCQKRMFGGSGKKKTLYFVTSCTVPTVFYVLCGQLCQRSAGNAAFFFRFADVAGHMTLAAGSAVCLFAAFALCPKKNESKEKSQK